MKGSKMTITFRPFSRPVREALTALVIAVSLCGCGSGTADQADIDPGWKLDEHGNPEFKPVDFEDAIGELKSRFGEIASLPAGESSGPARQFRQIVRWLPEFAADTPIRRAGWEDLAARTARMESAARLPGFFVPERAGDFRGEIEAIAALIPEDTLYRKPFSEKRPADAPRANDTAAPSADPAVAGGDAAFEAIDRMPEKKGGDR